MRCERIVRGASCTPKELMVVLVVMCEALICSDQASGAACISNI